MAVALKKEQGQNFETDWWSELNSNFRYRPPRIAALGLLGGPSRGGLDDPAPSFAPRSPRQCGEEGRSVVGWVRKQAAGSSLKILEKSGIVDGRDRI